MPGWRGTPVPSTYCSLRRDGCLHWVRKALTCSAVLGSSQLAVPLQRSDSDRRIDVFMGWLSAMRVVAVNQTSFLFAQTGVNTDWAWHLWTASRRKSRINVGIRCPHVSGVKPHLNSLKSNTALVTRYYLTLSRQSVHTVGLNRKHHIINLDTQSLRPEPL